MSELDVELFLENFSCFVLNNNRLGRNFFFFLAYYDRACFHLYKVSTSRLHTYVQGHHYTIIQGCRVFSLSFFPQKSVNFNFLHGQRLMKNYIFRSKSFSPSSVSVQIVAFPFGCEEGYSNKATELNACNRTSITEARDNGKTV